MNISLFIYKCWVFFSTSKVNHSSRWLGYYYFVWFKYFIFAINNTKLTIRVTTPNKKFSILIHCHWILWSTFNLCNLFQSFYFFWNSNILIITMTKSAKLTLTPWIDFSIFSKSYGMLETTCNLNNFSILYFSRNYSDCSVRMRIFCGILMFIHIWFFLFFFYRMTKLTMINTSHRYNLTLIS